MNDTFIADQTDPINITNMSNGENISKIANISYVTEIPEFLGLDYSFWFLILFAISIFSRCKNSFNKSNHKFIHYNTKKDKQHGEIIPDDTALDKIIGLESVKEEMRYYMDFIKNKQKYIDWKVKLPK